MKITLWITGLLALSNTACGMSPALHHANPNRKAEENQVVSQPAANRCDFEFKSQGLCANYGWVKEPTRKDEGSMKLVFFKQNQPSVAVEPSAASVFVKLWMPDMGHGSQKVVTLHSKNAQGFDLPGEFDATEVYFVMGGKWEIYVQLKDAGGNILDQAKVLYNAQ